MLKIKGIWWRCFFVGILLILIGINAIGLFLGDVIYREISVLHTHMNERQMNTLNQELEKVEQNRAVENITLQSEFGYSLYGTYIQNPQATDKTIIFLHGFAENRAAGLRYLDIYLKNGFNVLLIDARAHGKSGGDSVTWGVDEKYDLDTWVNWLAAHSPNGEIGVHGVSMGAATALMHAELNEVHKKVKFYIADSAYADLETLLLLKAKAYFAESTLPNIIFPYVNIIAYWNSRCTFYQAAPIRSVRKATTPILYLHGEADQLVPAAMTQELYQATKGPRKIYLFSQADHVGGIFVDPFRYGEVMREFFYFAKQQGENLNRSS